MDERQKALQSLIKAKVIAGESKEITYQSEWFFHFPFGTDRWIEHQGQNFTENFPEGWTLEDLACLEQTGFLEKLEEYENPEDTYDRSVRYRVWVECA